jgi:methyltransferase (TIGR00027 family)
MKRGQPSHTALRIAANYVAAAREPRFRPLLLHPDEPYSAWFVREFSPFFLTLWRWGPTRRYLYGLYESRTPGAPLYLLLRKRWIEEQSRRLLDADPTLRQVVVLGAGLDPLCLRLASTYPDLRCFEIDHPDTQLFKRSALDKHGALPKALHLEPLDFTQSSLDALFPRIAGFEPRQRTLFIAEGLFMYLDQSEVDRILTTLAGVAAPGSVALLTFVDRDRLEDPTSSVSQMAQVLVTMGEPLRSSVHRARLDSELQRFGWATEQIDGPEELRSTYLGGADSPLADGELLTVARRR